MQTTRRAALGAAFVGAAVGPAAAQTRANRGYSIPFTEVIPFTSALNHVHYLLYVRTPAAYARTTDRYPLIVTLDADYSFSICANHLEHLADRMNQGPQAILVSIAIAGVYPDIDRYHLERTRDYTPLYWADGGNSNTPFQRVSGGGPTFQRVIAEEVLPLIERRFRVNADDRTLVGHSYGGLFGAWTLQTRPDLFSRFLLASGSFWYANRWIFDREDEHTETRLPRKTRVYIACGSWEEQPERHGFMVSENIAFASKLAARGDPNLVVQSRVFEDETHASIFPAAFSTGIRHLFNTMN